MNAQDAGSLIGGFAIDAVTGKAVVSGAVSLSSKAKGLFEVVRKSEKIVEGTNALSQRYKHLADKITAVEDRVKKALGIVEQPQIAAAGVGEVGINLTEAEQLASKAAQEVIKDGGRVGELAKGLSVQEALKDINSACKQLHPSVGNIANLEIRMWD